MRADVPRHHVGVRVDAGPVGEALALDHPRLVDPLPHHRARLGPALVGESTTGTGRCCGGRGALPVEAPYWIASLTWLS